jgi:hypothetical protein
MNRKTSTVQAVWHDNRSSPCLPNVSSKLRQAVDAMLRHVLLAMGCDEWVMINIVRRQLP